MSVQPARRRGTAAPRLVGACLEPDCGEDPPKDAPLALCPKHMRTAFYYVLGLLRCNVEDIIHRPLDDTVASPAPMQGHVYYARRGGFVKIGTTTVIRKRMHALGMDESHLLAVEPGGYKLEKMRHAQFASARVQGEWFYLTDELKRHVEMLVEHFGHPLRHAQQAS